MVALADFLCLIALAMLVLVAWRNPRLCAAGPCGRRAERLMWISIVAIVVAVLIRP